MSGLKDFYNDHSAQNEKQTSKLSQPIALSIAKEFEDFQGRPAEVAIPGPHHPGLARNLD